MAWPTTAEELEREQEHVASLSRAPWEPAAGPLRVGAVAVVSGPGADGERAAAAAVVMQGGAVLATGTLVAPAGARFVAGRLALREGPTLEAVVRGLAVQPDVLLVAAAGHDHPRRAGLALHLGAVLDLPTVGVTDEPLRATGGAPAPARGAVAALTLGNDVVAYRVRTRDRTKPVVAHAGWRTTPELAAQLVLAQSGAARWPEPLRAARRLARGLRGDMGAS